MSPKSDHIIYLDLDGTLVDMLKGAQSWFDKKLGNDFGYSEVTKAEFWREVKRRYANGERPFLNFDKTPNADCIYWFFRELYPIDKISFLTGIGVSSAENIERDKREWVEKYYPGHDLFTVERKEEKIQFAGIGKILVDDCQDTRIQWERMGGKAVDPADFPASSSVFSQS